MPYTVTVEEYLNTSYILRCENLDLQLKLEEILPAS